MIFLGNLSVKQIEERTGITLSDADREFMSANRQEKVNNTELEVGKWHCYDIPFMLMTHDKQTAIVYRDMLNRYDWSKCREALSIGWEDGDNDAVN